MSIRTIDTTTEAPELVREILDQAVDQGATDVYWLPGRDSVRVRSRNACLQREVTELPLEKGGQCVTHLKVLGGLLTYRTSIAQDGVIRWGNDETEMRLASMPTLFGERLTIRLLNDAHTPESLDDLGFGDDVTDLLKRLLKRPDGMIVLTGPTGSGKSTTIYALVRELIRTNQDPASIITLEDPIERVIDGISQVAVQSDGDTWNYELALKAALRQDVKTLVVGEMRDHRVVKVVLDAALTGHRVITTYHAGDIAGVYTRLLHQGFEPFLIAAAITGVMTQRLVVDERKRLRPIGAVLEPDDDWRELICGNPSLGSLREDLRKRPVADIRQQARLMVQARTLSEEQATRISTL